MQFSEEDFKEVNATYCERSQKNIVLESEAHQIEIYISVDAASLDIRKFYGKFDPNLVAIPKPQQGYVFTDIQFINIGYMDKIQYYLHSRSIHCVDSYIYNVDQITLERVPKYAIIELAERLFGKKIAGKQMEIGCKVCGKGVTIDEKLCWWCGVAKPGKK